MEQIKISQRLLRRDLNSRVLRNHIQQYNFNLLEGKKIKKDKKDHDKKHFRKELGKKFEENREEINSRGRKLNKKVKKNKEGFKHLQRRLNVRGGRNKLDELIELEIRGFFT